ncbi:hypothetical protein BDW75DRAFT_221856 [Aspergillus navahoensis]
MTSSSTLSSMMAVMGNANQLGYAAYPPVRSAAVASSTMLIFGQAVAGLGLSV